MLEYRYQLALSSRGHACVCLDNEVWVFLPENLSKKQKEWFLKKEYFFKRHKNRLYYAIVSQNNEILSAMEYESKGDSYKYLFQYIRESLEYEKKGKIQR